MQAYLTLTRRELSAYFLSMTGYIIIAAVMFLLGFSFYVVLVKLQGEATIMPVTELFYKTQFFWLILLLATPVITMRLFALEKFSGTLETLLTTPVTDFQVVLAKFTAAMVFYMVMWLPLLGCILVVRHFTNDMAPLDVGAVGGTYLGILLLGGVFVSLGCCASALTRSQVAAAMMGLAFGASLFLLAFLAQPVSAKADWQAQVLACFGFTDQMGDFTRGIVDTRPVTIYLTITFFFLYLTLRIIESRRWK
jgi:ABC-2 type transport system permease protein